jgi:hypothetical protein
MPKKSIQNNEEVIIDLLQKQIIIDLLNKKITRENIKKILGVGTDKVSFVQKYLKIKDE